MDRHGRREIRAVADKVAGWVAGATNVGERRSRVREDAGRAVEAFRGAVLRLGNDSERWWSALPLGAADRARLDSVACASSLAPVSDADEALLGEVSEAVPDALRTVKGAVGGRRFISGEKRRAAGVDAADYLRSVHDRGVERGIERLLAGLTGGDIPGETPPVGIRQTAGAVAARLPNIGDGYEIIDVCEFRGLADAISQVETILHRERYLRDAVRAAVDTIKRSGARPLLTDMAIEHLRDVTRDRIPVRALRKAGITSVSDVLHHGRRLGQLDGIGAATAGSIRAAADRLFEATCEEFPLRLDPRDRSPGATLLLVKLDEWSHARRLAGAQAELAEVAALTPLKAALRDDSVSHVVVAGADRGVGSLRHAVAHVIDCGSRAMEQTRLVSSNSAWDNFIARPADYYALLSELGLNADEENSRGDLPDELVEAIRVFELNTDAVTATLRAYQNFAARFALVQRKVVIGDEMGLGKTIEAIAVRADQHSRGVTRSLVVCPAAVITNWMREIADKSTLRAHRLHGNDRQHALRNWRHHGGVAVTSYGTLGALPLESEIDESVGYVVFDEAHYIKNPQAKRSRRSTRLIKKCDGAILLTGTPMENHVAEFRNLVGYLRPDLTVGADEFRPRKFRRQIAPAPTYAVTRRTFSPSSRNS